MPVPVSDENSPWYESVGGFLEENMDIPLGMSMGLAGAKIGARTGNPYIAAGVYAQVTIKPFNNAFSTYKVNS